MSNSQSTYTAQNVFDDLVARGDLDPGWDMAGFTVRPIITILNTVFQQICGGKGMFPWKWNQFNLPVFYFNSWQQDYALVPSVTNLAWLQEGMAIDINNPQMPKPWSYVEVGRNLGRSSGAYISNSVFVQPLCVAAFLPNSQLYYGTWGAAAYGNGTWGNNPQPNQVITNPLGNGTSMPPNPILQIQDANANLLVLTTFGTTGGSAPSASSGAAPGTTVSDGSCVWTVVDPQGSGIRITPTPANTGTVWQVNLVGQQKPVKFSAATSLSSQTLYPLTDDFYPHFLDGCTAQCYRYSPNAKTRAMFKEAEGLWLQSISEMAREVDREKEENTIRPKRTIIGAGGGPVGRNYGPFWPYGGRPS